MIRSTMYTLFLILGLAMVSQPVGAEELNGLKITSVTADYQVAKIDATIGNCSKVLKSQVAEPTQSTMEITNSFDVASLNCGLRPLPPLGCRVGSCVCNSMGQNCSWTFVCN